jgi:DHA2 family multidrug resistance protein
MTASAGRDSGPTSSGGVSTRPVFAVAAVLLGSFLANFDSRLTSVGLADLRGAFSLGFDEGAWLSTASIGSQIFVAPAIAWLATTFGLRRILGIPCLVYALVSLAIPFVRYYPTLLALGIVHGMLLGAFVPATLMIILRNLPMRWWLPAIAIYAIRVGFALDTSTSLIGLYVERLGWQWMYWQSVLIAPLMAVMVRLGTPEEPIDRDLLRDADWGGMLLLGSSMAMIYAALDQGNRLDWLASGEITSLLICGIALFVAFLVNESVVKRPWAHVDVLFSRNIGLAQLIIVFYTLASVSNASLVPNFLATVASMRPEQSGVVLLEYGAAPMLLLVPLSVYVLRRFDGRLALIVGLSAFAEANLLGTRLTGEWARLDFATIVLLQSVGQAFSLLPIIVLSLANADPTRATAFAAYVQVMRLGGSEIGVAAMGTWLRVREQIHSNFLGQHVENGSFDTVAALARMAQAFGGEASAFAMARATAVLAGRIQREANVLAYIDGFWLCFWAAIPGLILVGLMTKAPPGPFSPGPSIPVRPTTTRTEAAT